VAYKLKTAPAAEPVSSTEAKAHLRVDHTDDDTLIGTLIITARRFCEEYLNQSLITQTWYNYLNDFYDGAIYYVYRGPFLMINKGPVQSITSIKYYDADDVEQTLSTDYYHTDLSSQPARIEVSETPETYDKLNAVTIEFVAGYGDAADVPEHIKHAMLLYIGHLYENRGDEGHRTPPRAFYDILNQNRIKTF